MRDEGIRMRLFGPQIPGHLRPTQKWHYFRRCAAFGLEQSSSVWKRDKVQPVVSPGQKWCRVVSAVIEPRSLLRARARLLSVWRQAQVNDIIYQSQHDAPPSYQFIITQLTVVFF